MKKWKARAYRLALACLPQPKREFRSGGSVPEGVKRALCRRHAVGAALAVFGAHGVKGVAVYGSAGSTPVAENTAFRAASISKHITALAAFRLHEAGHIDLDADVDAFLPCSLRHPKAPDTPITLRRLLTHTAGIQDGADYAAACADRRPLSALMRGDVHTPEFGSFVYSNLGAGIAACALEGMLGKDFETIMQETLFEPLHVQATFYPQNVQGPLADACRVLPPRKTLDAETRRAQPLPPPGPDPERHYLLSHGNLWISAPELAKLGMELLKERYAPMRRSAVSFGARDRNLQMGLSTFIVDASICGKAVYGHQGLAYGAMHGLFYDPASGRGFALLTTGCSEAREGVLSDVNKDFIRMVL